MKTCFYSPMIITQSFGNDFWVDVNNKYHPDEIEKMINDKFRIYEEKKNKYISFHGEKVYIKLYYKSMGINGHDGIDVIPEDQSDFTIMNILPGIIKIFMKHEIYGNRIAIWNPELNLTEYHNHLEYLSNDLRMNKEVQSGTILGKMGMTGKVFGIHNHLAYAKTNSRADRINRGNGYYGYIDPASFILHGVH